MSFAFPQGYGYCFAVLGGASFVNIGLAINVAMARKKYNVQYPNLYAPPETNKKDAEAFNCIQRAHQNTLESYSIVMLQMMAAGLKYPLTSAFCGFMWVLGRVIYGYGYSVGGPKGRMAGGLISHLGDFPLMITVLKIAYDLWPSA